MKCSFLSFFQVDLLLLILGDPGAVCQGNAFSIHPTPGSPGPPKMITVRPITQSNSIMVLYVRYMYDVPIKI